jgi:hypothetical protein
MGKVWITKNGVEIPYCNLELSHLKNIISFIKPEHRY